MNKFKTSRIKGDTNVTKETIEDTINNMTFDELQATKGLVEAAIEVKKVEVLAEIEARMKEAGIDPSELKGASTKRRKSPAKKRKLHPTDDSLSWAGAGPRPKWLHEYLADGGKLEDLRDED